MADDSRKFFSRIKYDIFGISGVFQTVKNRNFGKPLMGTSQLLSIRNTERITKLVKNSEAYRLQYIQISKKFL
jgi:hypothetical protein